jgi:hypothetical protein
MKVVGDLAGGDDRVALAADGGHCTDGDAPGPRLGADQAVLPQLPGAVAEPDADGDVLPRAALGQRLPVGEASTGGGADRAYEELRDSRREWRDSRRLP